MIKQGDIIKVDLNPTKGHEQQGYRPVVVVSNHEYTKYTGELIIVCPITNTINGFPMHVPLDSRTNITGCVLCEQMRTIDFHARPIIETGEKLPDDLLQIVLGIVRSELELIKDEKD